MRKTAENSPESFDVIVIGAGFGGMAAALELARSGASVALFETLVYPGGCASTFKRRGQQYESGATLFSGFGPGQLFRRWIDDLGLQVEFEELDPVVQLRTETFELAIPTDRDRLIERFCAMPGADGTALRGFFAQQKAVADVLWELFDDPALIPPFGPREMLRHIGRSPRYARLLPLIGRPLQRQLRRWGVDEFEPLRTYLNAVGQITVQAGVDEAEAPFAMAAMDYYFRGTGHVRGGVGQLAWELVRAFERAGGTLFLGEGARALVASEAGWEVTTRRRTVHADHVVANLLPGAVQRLTSQSNARLERLSEDVAQGWGATMLYVTLDAEALATEGAHHLELVGKNGEPFVEGNHLFVSVGGANEAERALPGNRTATISTHVPMREFVNASADFQASYIENVQRRMRETLALRAPEIAAAVTAEMTASPRTFERFTGRPQGYVGGIPRRAGLHNYRDILPSPVLDRLYMVGDTMFPGQSTLATAIGGVKVARSIAA